MIVLLFFYLIFFGSILIFFTFFLILFNRPLFFFLSYFPFFPLPLFVFHSVVLCVQNTHKKRRAKKDTRSPRDKAVTPKQTPIARVDRSGFIDKSKPPATTHLCDFLLDRVNSCSFLVFCFLLSFFITWFICFFAFPFPLPCTISRFLVPVANQFFRVWRCRSLVLPLRVPPALGRPLKSGSKFGPSCVFFFRLITSWRTLGDLGLVSSIFPTPPRSSWLVRIFSTPRLDCAHSATKIRISAPCSCASFKFSCLI